MNHPDGFLLNTIIQEKKRKIDSAIISTDQSDGLREMSAKEIKERVMALLNPVEEEISSAPDSLFLPRFHTYKCRYYSPPLQITILPILMRLLCNEVLFS